LDNMPNFDAVVNRIKRSLATTSRPDPTNTDVIKALKMHEPHFYKAKKEEDLPYAKILRWCLDNKISIDWIMFGELHGKTNSPLPINNKDGLISIIYYPDVKASAGGGCVNGDCPPEQEYYTASRDDIPTIDYSGLIAVRVSGDSMEPTIKDGGIIICDTHQKKFIDNGIFIVNSYDETFVKRLRKSKLNEAVTLVSDNPYYGYEDRPISAVELVGRVLRRYGSEEIK
jgi:hypothetical protein